jgi:hypothetical protein
VDTSTSSAQAFLAKWGVSFDDLLAQVRPVDASETMWLVGSIADGLATSFSDINLLIIGDRGLDATLVFGESGFEQSVARLPRGQRIKTEYWRAEDVEQLQRRLAAVMHALYGTAPLAQVEAFSDLELRLLHRMRTGLVLANAARATQWRREMQVDSLPDYLLVHWVASHHALREDAWGQAREGDRLSAWWMARAALDYLAAAMLASVGETNPYPKWRLRLLQRNREVLGPPAVERITGLLFPDARADLVAHLHELTAFAGEVLERTLARHAARGPALPSINTRLQDLTRPPSTRPADDDAAL